MAMVYANKPQLFQEQTVTTRNGGSGSAPQWPSSSAASTVASVPEQSSYNVNNVHSERLVAESAQMVRPMAHAATAPSLGHTGGHRRRGCQHCVTCIGLQNHRHSTMNRSAQESGAEWWPGGIQSPSVYYHLRARQLQHQIRHPSPGTPQWRQPHQVTTKASELLARRNQAPLAILIPITCTNVPQGDAAAVCLGEKVVALPKAAGASPASNASSTAASAASTPIVPVTSPVRVSWPHSTPEHRSGASTSFAAPMEVERCPDTTEAKRRCTEALAVASSSTTRLAGHFIAPTAHYTSPFAEEQQKHVPIFPGRVIQHDVTNPPTVVLPSQPSIATVPPPLMLINSASGLTASLTSSDSEGSSGSISDLCHNAIASVNDLQGLMMPRVVTSWEVSRSNASTTAIDNNSNKQQQPWPPTVPVLQPVRDLHDPTLTQYYQRQANIKAEQAFSCHQVVDLSAVPLANSDGKLQGQAEQQNNTSPWSSMLRTIAGTLKRSISP